MPTSVAAAIVGSIVATSATSVIGGIIGAGLIATALGAVAGGLASGIVSQAFADKPSAPAAELERESQGRLVTVRQAAAPWQWIYGETRVGGIISYMATSTDNQYLHLVITLAGHECNQLGTIYFDEESVPLDGSGNATGKYAGYVRIQKSEGDEADGAQPFIDLVSETAALDDGTDESPAWKSTDRQTGRAKIYVRLKWNEDLFPNGIPNVTCLIQGRKVFDPRTDLTVYSNNAALCVNDYICHAIGLNATYADEVDDSEMVSAANTCDEDVLRNLGSPTQYEDRYTINGAFYVQNAPREVLQRMLTAMGGNLRFISGEWSVRPASYQTPTVTLTQDDLRGTLNITPRISRRDICNAVKGVYINPDNDWQAADFPPIVSATYYAEDNNERIWRELDLPFTQSPATAQRIAKIELERVRQQITVNWPGKLKCYQLQAGDTVMVTLSRYGWTSKVFEVQSVSLAHEDQDGGIVLGADLVLRETASAIYDWTAGTDETVIDPAPDTNLPDPFTVAAPGNPSVSEDLYETRDGRGVAVKAIVVVPAAADYHVSSYILEYKLSTDSAWTVLAPVRAAGGQDCTIELLDFTPGIFSFRAKSVNQIGIKSASYSGTTSKEIVGLGARPAAMTGLAIQKMGGLAILKWEKTTELDVLRGGRVILRHNEATSGATWEGSFSIGDSQGVGGDQVMAVLPLKPGTYLAKFEDSTGNQQITATTVVSDAAVWLPFSTIGTAQEDATFPGTHSNTYVDAGALKLVGAGLFDDIPDVDAESSLDGYGGVVASGTYLFQSTLDLTSKQRVKLVGTLVGTTVNVNDLIDDRSGDIDDWLDFDGSTGGGSTDCYLEVRSSDDNVTYSAWNRLDASEQYARYFQFRAVLVSTDVAYTPSITQMRVKQEQAT